MKKKEQSKTLLPHEIMKKISILKKAGKTVVQSHGIFDIIHPGIVQHLLLAKEQGDVLVVTVIQDKDVRRGPGRPIFPDVMRAANVAAMSMVDFVCIVDDEKPFECVKWINPNIFAKGRTSKDPDSTIHNSLLQEEKELYLGQVRIHETGGFAVSSTGVVKDFVDIYPPEVKSFLKDFSKKYSYKTIHEKIDSLKKLRVLLIGDGIIDEYHYCDPMGKSMKANLVVYKYQAHEVFAGGAFAIANHLAGICKDVQIVSLLGDADLYEDFVLKNLKPNVNPKFFKRTDGPTIVKKRYVNQYLNQKLFEIDHMNDGFVEPALESKIIRYLESAIPDFDIVLVSDFGHGLVTDRIIKAIEKTGKKFAVNTQTNGANIGYNLITRYKNPAFTCLDESELRLAGQDKYSDIETVLRNIRNKINTESIIVTLGKKGSMGINKSGHINRTPIFSGRVIDTVGAGDAFFAFTAPCLAKNLPFDLVSFIGNAVGALAVQIVCNKKSVEKYELLEFIRALLK